MKGVRGVRLSHPPPSSWFGLTPGLQDGNLAALLLLIFIITKNSVDLWSAGFWLLWVAFEDETPPSDPQDPSSQSLSNPDTLLQDPTVITPKPFQTRPPTKIDTN